MVLGEEYEFLLSKKHPESARERLKIISDAICKLLNISSLQLDYRVENSFQNTPETYIQREKDEKHNKMENDFLQDPTVRQLQRLMGAQIVENSLRPIAEKKDE